MSKEIKPQIYYMVRRGWHDQLLKFTDNYLVKKGKDPTLLFWKAYAVGMIGNTMEALQILEGLHSRREIQYPITLAMTYFHKRSPHVDREQVRALESELAVAEDITKDGGMVLAARFACFTGDLKLASSISQRVLRSTNGGPPSTPIEVEASCVEHWVTALSAMERLKAQNSTSDMRQAIQGIEGEIRGRYENTDVDLMMLLARCKQLIRHSSEALNVYNQVIAMYPWYIAGLTEKAVMLASLGEWEQALDTAQRALDVDAYHIDALQVVAVHAFTQDCDENEAQQKLEDFESAMSNREPNAIHSPLWAASLFANICSRHYRALQTCSRMIERALRLNPAASEEAALLTEMGYINYMQGPSQYQNALRSFREASKKDPTSASALQGMVLCQIMEGAFDDAEAQIDLLTVMHAPEDLGAEFAYLQALLAKNARKDMKIHAEMMEKCKELFYNRSVRSTSSSLSSYDIMAEFVVQSPDFLMSMAVEFLSHIESVVSASIGPAKDSKDGANVGGANNGATVRGRTMGFDMMATRIGGGAGGTVTMLGTGGTMTVMELGADGTAQETGGQSAVDHGQSSLTMGGIEISPAVESGLDILQKLLRTCPGFICAYVEMARSRASLGLHEEACRVLHRCLQLQPKSTAALVTMAKIEASRNATNAANRSLEQALSYDFHIRSIALFRLVRCTILNQQGNYEDAIKEMEDLIQLPEIRSTSALGVYTNPRAAEEDVDILGPRRGRQGEFKGEEPPLMMNSSYADSFRLTDDDRVGAFVTLSQLYGKLRRTKEANKILSEAKVVFSGTPQEVVVLVAASQLAVEKNDYDSAIRMLDKIPDDSLTFVRAQLIKADILLHHSRDHEAYAQCFHLLVEREKTAKHYSLLGEAYLKILNPERAVDAFEAARKLDPNNARLRARIGRALVATHEYHRAIDFYEHAILDAKSQNITMGSIGPPGSSGATVSGISSEAVTLSHDLAKLFMKLDRGEAGIRVLSKVIHETHRDVTDMRQDVATLLLLAEVQGAVDHAKSDSLSSLRKAYDLQKDILSQIRAGIVLSSAGATAERERIILSDICERNATAQATLQKGDDRDRSPGEDMYREAIQHNPHNTKAMLGLAQILRDRGDIEGCQAQANKVILADPSNEEGTIMLSEAIFAGSNPDSATAPLENLLKEHPNNYSALERLISLLRRAGKLDQVPALLAAAEAADRRSLAHAGYRYCSALYHRYTNDISKAILEFNLSRKDDTWGPHALAHMIELYLNPDQDGAWEERESGPLDETTSEHVRVAEKLLEELRPKAKDAQRFKVLENYYLLGTRNKTKIDQAMQSFMDMLDHDQDYLPAILGMSTGFMVEKNAHKARNLLKRVGKMEISSRDGEDFTKANLLLAKFYVDKEKNDLAQELCKKCLVQDRSCGQAWEILGLVMEKDLNYENASECYEKAWKLEFEASASVGFKLAWTYLKCKRYIDCIDICEKVLAQYPDYPRIREEILKKAQYSIRCVESK